ncbi:heavy metal-associated isoprenylated plant protein 47-like [Cicer arietinum]|uniref:Heavy metal-associated isoprenylated plant protein 47-like n=1 Tax=Cicer arietinum TaxID=3827 RepID=A0A3Q7XLD7_CICAR|nr:heavy metal-associated isoprenylated plant protein 47-like [Cicer arietinum]
MKKIVIRVHMKSDKFRSRAMKIAAAFQGVVSVSLEGENRDQIVVTGDQIDCVCLTKKLRKKISYATLLSVVDANTSSEEGSEAKEEQKDAANTSSIENLPIVCCKQNNPMPCPSYYIVHDPYPNSCSIL